MEGKLCCELIQDIFDDYGGIIVIGLLVTDDDSTIRSHCTNKKEVVKLEGDTPAPIFLADPGNRIKLMDKAIFNVAQKAKIPMKSN